MAERDIEYLAGGFLGDHDDFNEFDGVEEALDEADTDREEHRRFIEGQRPVTTARKTKYDCERFHAWLVEQKSEHRPMEQLPAVTLDLYLADFFMKIKKKGEGDYEPDTLTSFHASFDRYLRAANYQHSLITSREFAHSREMLSAKRKQLKSLGLGNKTRKATPFTASELDSLREKNLLGLSSPESLVNQMFLNNCVFFGMRGRTEHHVLLWSDILLRTTHDGREYLQYTERSNKTRQGEKPGPNSSRQFEPKAFEDRNIEVCPVNAYKVYRDRRPESMKKPDSKFYLSIIQNPKTDIWFKELPMGVNKLGDLMKTMSSKGQLTDRKVNHSGRKTCVSNLLHAGVPPTMIKQLTGHRNLESINHYATASLQQQQGMSRALSSSITETIQSEGSCLPSTWNVRRNEATEDRSTGPAFSSRLANETSCFNPRGVFGGNSIMGGSFNFHFHTDKKRPRVLDSDTDSE